jgi:hypothetical protein
VSLRHFEAGWGWEAQLRQLIRTKYQPHLAGLASLDPVVLTRLLGGELLAGRPYATIQWVLRRTPYRPLELYFLFDQDPEFGSDVRIFFARKSLVVPTEDAYVFAWDYLALLARYGRGDFPVVEAAPGPEWVPYADFAPAAAGPLAEVSVKPREEALRLLPVEVAEVALRRLDCGTFRAANGTWEIVWPLLGDLLYRLQVGPAAVLVAFDSHGARKDAPEFLMSFAWLYINALLRECRQVDPSLPRLSRYL